MHAASLARRYAAWSLDALVIGCLACLACSTVILTGLSRIDAAFPALAGSIARLAADTVDRGDGVMQLLQLAMADASLRLEAEALAGAIVATLWPPMLAFALIALVYHAAFEASTWQASPGKRLLGLRVVDATGARLPWHRAALRQVAGVLSWLSLNLGHLWAALPPRHVALHDVIARARVLCDQEDAALPAWATAWLWLQAALLSGLLAWWLQTTNAALQAAFDAIAL